MSIEITEEVWGRFHSEGFLKLKAVARKMEKRYDPDLVIGFSTDEKKHTVTITYKSNIGEGVKALFVNKVVEVMEEYTTVFGISK